jgi:hypothetical protein
MAGEKKRELTEEAALEAALRDHPDWRRAWDQGELPEEIVGEDGEPMSPRVHLHSHAVVERQLAADEPKGVVAIAQQLERLGVSRHSVRHEIGAAVAKHMWYMTKEGCPFDEGRFLEWWTPSRSKSTARKLDMWNQIATFHQVGASMEMVSLMAPPGASFRASSR